ncbi:hypothetical protein [Catenovulum maritimum]|uniref:Uncharacterized protein n=1 Tax=Catenovulum maritimum TaxID=1513271 RepID=A0A0J8GMH7_9ALTE|nr:hypothetical protein [Catenovulum maritimum]KMT63995.1 hypothetical protein XM47_16490 [Catenovulum maritimum]
MSDSDLFFGILCITGYLAPISFVLNDTHTKGQEKNFWLIAMIFLSWLAWLAYITSVPNLLKDMFSSWLPEYLFRSPAKRIKY